MIKQAIRRISAALLCCVLFVGMLPYTAYSDISVEFNTQGYSWWPNQQGYRFSVYDFTNNKTVMSMDIFSKDAAILDPLKSDEAGGTDTTNDGRGRFKYVEASYLRLDQLSSQNIANIRLGTGCKFDYLYRYNQSKQLGQSFYDYCCNEYSSFFVGPNSVANSRNQRNYTVYSLSNYTNPNDPIAQYDTGFMPISEEKSDNFNHLAYYKPNRDISRELLTFNNITMAYILAVMGFSVDDSRTYFDPEQYVLVIEPIFWFYNKYFANRARREFFYGTVTEWAIYNQATKNSGYRFKGESRSSIRQIMGRLTALAGPISTINSRNKFVDSGEVQYGEVLNSLVLISEDDAREYCSGYYTERVRNSDEDILKYWGYDTMCCKELYSFFVDIVSTNTEFIAGEEAILAFIIGQRTDYGNSKTLAPDIRDCAGDKNNIPEGAYGLKLKIETSTAKLRNGARPDIGPSDAQPIELTCDGMPAENYNLDTSPFNTTLCWGKIKVPDKAGVWKIKVSPEGLIFDQNDRDKSPRLAWKEWFNNGSILGTNNGYRRGSTIEDRTTPSVYFEITVKDAQAQSSPSNPKYNDTMPSGFEIKSVAEAEAELPASNNTASWTFWKLTDIVENGFNEVGEPEYAPHFDLVTETLSLDMGNRYYPCTYGSLPGAETVRYNGENVLKIRSGYGFGVSMNMNNSGTRESITDRTVYVNDTEIIDELEARKYYSDINLVSMSGCVKVPEYKYGQTAEELVNDGGIIKMRKNPFSKYYDTKDYSKIDYSRVHFTPVWYPDGEYNILVQSSIWTPRGKLTGHCFNTILIDGTVYDDWYITRIRG